MCHRLADLESMGTEPTELSGTASLELGEISSDGAGEETSFSSYLYCLYTVLTGSLEITGPIYSS